MADTWVRVRHRPGGEEPASLAALPLLPGPGAALEGVSRVTMLHRFGPERAADHLVPTGGVVKEFTEAATDALHEALRWKPPRSEQPYYNVYLDRGLHFQGATGHLPDLTLARRKRKKAFMLSSKVQWAITFSRERKQALVEHRAGFRCHFQGTARTSA